MLHFVLAQQCQFLDRAATLVTVAVMGGDDDRAASAAALAWWIEAGVDVAISETPRNWLAGTAQPPAPSTASADAATTVHEDLGAFRHWLGTEAGLPLDRPGARRVLPNGTEQAEIMFLSEAPGREDGDQPIGGDAWALGVRMLAAIGFTPDLAYRASLACFDAAGTRIGTDELAACAAIARRHIALARPKRLILLGDGPSRALLGEPLVRARGRLHKVEGVRTIATIHPRQMLNRPSDKALAWRDLLLLMEEDL